MPAANPSAPAPAVATPATVNTPPAVAGGLDDSVAGDASQVPAQAVSAAQGPLAESLIVVTPTPTTSSAPSTSSSGGPAPATTPAASAGSGKLRVINQGLLNTSGETNIQQSRSSTPMSAGEATSAAAAAAAAAAADLDLPPPSVGPVVAAAAAVAGWPGSPAWAGQAADLTWPVADDGDGRGDGSLVWPGASQPGNWTTTSESWNVPEGEPRPANPEKKAVSILQKTEQGTRGDGGGASSTWHRSEPPPPPPMTSEEETESVPVSPERSDTPTPGDN